MTITQRAASKLLKDPRLGLSDLIVALAAEDTEKSRSMAARLSTARDTIVAIAREAAK